MVVDCTRGTLRVLAAPFG